MAEVDVLEDKILKYLKKTVPSHRMKHILGVMKLSEKLALKHKLNSGSARLAGLLHDMTRYWKDEKLVRYAKEHSLKIPDRDFIIQYQPVLLHSYVSADLARGIFNVRNGEILSAVQKHSLGAVRMSPFEKLVYLADLLAPDRKFPGANRLRDLAFKNMDRAFVEGVRIKMLYVLSLGEQIHPETVRVWNHFVSGGKKSFQRRVVL